jgi:hypothetical protein
LLRPRSFGTFSTVPSGLPYRYIAVFVDNKSKSVDLSHIASDVYASQAGNAQVVISQEKRLAVDDRQTWGAISLCIGGGARATEKRNQAKSST